MSITIVLDNSASDICYAGQTISGRVECFFNSRKTIRAIRLRFKGKAKTKWTRGYGKNSTTYSAEEIYLNQEYNLVSGPDEIQIDAGSHSYPFAYVLPESLPSSFESKYGKVKYKITATVDRPWKIDYEHELILNVYSPLDLNSIPEAKRPYAISIEKQVSNGCCSSDSPFTFNISLPSTGFAVGQEINIGAFVQNMSNVTIECVYFRLNQVMHYIARSPWSNDKNKEFSITYCSSGAIGAHAEKAWTSTLTIPPNGNFPNLRSCSIINATYKIEAEVILPSPHSNLTHEFPIIIGTVPLTGINMGLPTGPPPLPDGYHSNSNATAPPMSANGSSSADVDISFPPDVYMPSKAPPVTDM